MEHYDYLIVGAGLFGAVFAHEAQKAGKSVLVIDKRPQIAGNVYTEDMEGIHVHKVRCPYFPYESEACVGLCESVCCVQPFHQFSGGQLSWGTLFPSF